MKAIQKPQMKTISPKTRGQLRFIVNKLTAENKRMRETLKRLAGLSEQASLVVKFGLTGKGWDTRK